MKGLIVIGYPGVGKSSIAGKDGCVDLESGNFFVGEERWKFWCETYCQTAMDIANQGYTVFVSSHKNVLECLNSMPLLENVGKVCVFCPRRTMAVEWIEKLKARFEKTRLFKDYKAWNRAARHYEEDILSFNDCGLPVYQPEVMDYDLMDYVKKMRVDWCK